MFPDERKFCLRKKKIYQLIEEILSADKMPSDT